MHAGTACKKKEEEEREESAAANRDGRDRLLRRGDHGSSRRRAEASAAGVRSDAGVPKKADGGRELLHADTASRPVCGGAPAMQRHHPRGCRRRSHVRRGRVWAGHNIQRFDCHRIKEAFADIGRPPPEPKGLIDSLAILTHGFGRRAGDLKVMISSYASFPTSVAIC
ncbi:hypothetical protein B296_00002777 [Ensete ventricosum]|uniref:Exonuclease domain-containing protein n=1 Tax=Ensete ventricosum TaxID=4639 RepID=A0A427A8P0_ENSVE|nr:hypothetical protein B296_00002777 [Ensete ventricosum]